MPVTKFRTIEEMNEFDRERLRSKDPRLFDRIDYLWRNWRNLLPPLGLPEGVHKFRSIEDMNAFKAQYQRARMARIRAERVRR